MVRNTILKDLKELEKRIKSTKDVQPGEKKNALQENTTDRNLSLLEILERLKEL